MDAFWVIPSAIVLLICVSIFYAYIKRHPVSPSEGRVLLDKPGKSEVDPSIKHRDWSKRPCGNFLEWLTGHRRS